MSKTALKKELVSMSADQLRDIILDAYDARTEFKEYFEFFLNPDTGRLIEKHRNRLVKELNRTHWGRSKARVSVIKKAVKEFIGFRPDPEAVLDMMFLTLHLIGTTERYINIIDTHVKYIKALTLQIIDYADDNEMASEAIDRIGNMLNSGIYSDYFVRIVRESIAREAEKH